MLVEKMVINVIANLTVDEQMELARHISKCSDCGKTIIRRSNRHHRCDSCAAKAARESNRAWAKRNLTSVCYEHDAYISKKR